MRFFVATLLGSALLGCGSSTTDTDGSPTNAVDCDAIARGQSCSSALFDEVQTCVGQLDMMALVYGKFSSDGASCTDGQDATRVVEFDPPAPSADKSMWIKSLVKIDVKRGGTTCGSVAFSSSPWSRAITTKSGTFSIESVDSRTATWTCPNGEQGNYPVFDPTNETKSSCSAKIPIAEAIGGSASDAEYSWGPFEWFYCLL